MFGEYTDNLLAMRLPIEMVRSGDISENLRNHIIEGTNYIQVHPTYLYESLWCLMVLAIMLIYWKHKRFEGEIALIYLGGYGLGRAWIEESVPTSFTFTEQRYRFPRYLRLSWWSFPWSVVWWFASV